MIRQATMVNLRAVLVLLAVAVAAACAAKPAEKSGTEPVSDAPAPVDEAAAERAASDDGEKPVIDLMSLTISQEGRPIARLHPDGRTEGTEPDATGKPAHFVPGPTLRADGTITLTKGRFTARVERDGDIFVVSPPGQGSSERPFGRISGNELALAHSDQAWAVRIDGDLIRFNGPGFPNKIEGKVDDASRRTALVMTAAFFIDMSITSR